jgi:multiple sugar transport system permease protein
MNGWWLMLNRLFDRMTRPAWFIVPYWFLFAFFIVIPVLAAIALSFTFFNSIQAPTFVGVNNYIELITLDTVFMRYVLPNTLRFAFIVGPVGYALSFIVAWMLSHLPKTPRTILAIIFYSPSLTAGVAMAAMWRIIFSGDAQGYLNAFLLDLGLIVEPIQFLQDPNLLMTIMIVVSLWSSIGVGFLAMLAGILNVDRTLYEAAYIDGIKNWIQEIIYVTIPAMKPQMIFGAVMAVVGTFQAGAIGVALSGTNPTPNYAGQLIVNHIEDFGFIRYMMGYAASVSVILLVMVYAISKITWKFLGEKD